MTKTKEELIHLRTEYETLTNKLKELTSEELKLVTGGGRECDEYLACGHGHGNNGKPTLILWDET